MKREPHEFFGGHYPASPDICVDCGRDKEDLIHKGICIDGDVLRVDVPMFAKEQGLTLPQGRADLNAIEERIGEALSMFNKSKVSGETLENVRLVLTGQLRNMEAEGFISMPFYLRTK